MRPRQRFYCFVVCTAQRGFPSSSGGVLGPQAIIGLSYEDDLIQKSGPVLLSRQILQAERLCGRYYFTPDHHDLCPPR